MKFSHITGERMKSTEFGFKDTDVGMINQVGAALNLLVSYIFIFYCGMSVLAISANEVKY